MKRTSISLDIETFATNATAPIRSIGAVAFLENETNTFDELLANSFYVNILDQSYDTLQVRNVFKNNPKTEKFWAEQAEEARNAFLSPEPVDILSALQLLSDWVGKTLGEKGHVWANPPTFDLVIINQHYHHFGLEIPYHYRTYKCMRTLSHAANYVSTKPIELDPSFIRVVKHNALHDAAYQAGVIQQTFRKIKNA